MDDNRLMVISGIIALILAAGGGEAPSGHIYAGLMDQMELAEYQTALDLGRYVGYWTVAGSHMVTLTPEGAAFAAQMAKLM